MLGLTDILQIVKTTLEFPSVVLAFVHLVRETPQEKHEDLLKRMMQESRQFEDGGRPKW